MFFLTREIFYEKKKKTIRIEDDGLRALNIEPCTFEDWIYSVCNSPGIIKCIGYYDWLHFRLTVPVCKLLLKLFFFFINFKTII